MNAATITMDGLTTPENTVRFARLRLPRTVETVSDDEDAQLMLAYARGEMRAFETLYSRHRGALYRYLTRQARDGEIANDLFQEVWSRVIVNRARYEPRAKFRTFLFTLAHNCFIDHCRRTKARPAGLRIEEADDADLLPAAEDTQPDAALSRDETSRRYRAALADSARRAARRLSTARGIGFVAGGHSTHYRGRRRDGEEPVALRGGEAQGGIVRDGGLMTGPDDEFEDFLNRRKPVFRRPEDEMFEPPAELDRVVLRQAREAIKPPEPMRMFSAPRWSMPIALAATLLLAFTVVFRAGMPQPKSAPKPEVTVQNVAERVDAPSAAASQSPSTVVADLAQPAQARNEAGASVSREAAPAEVASAPAAKAGETYAWRRDPKSWQAEIQRLRDAGDNARADAESAEFKRQQRAYAVAPDR